LSSYPEAEINQIKVCLTDGLSASQIANRISEMRGERVSRNAILGLVHRNKDLKAIGFTEKLPVRSDKTAKTAPARARSPAPSRMPQLAFLRATPDFEPREPTDYEMLTQIPRPRSEELGDKQAYDASSKQKLLGELKEADCHWPVNEPEKGDVYLFCAQPVQLGQRYCRHHVLRSIQCR